MSTGSTGQAKKKEEVKLLPAKAGAAATPKAPQPPLPQREPWWLSPWVVGGVAVLVAIGFGVGVVFASVKASRGDEVLPRVQVAGIDLGGLTREQAQAALSTRAEAFTTEEFSFTFVRDDGSEKKFNATADDLGLVVDVGASVEVAFGVGHRDNFVGSLAGQLVSAFGGTDADVVLQVDRDSLEGFLSTAFLKVEKPARDARLSYVEGSLKVVEARAGNEVGQGPVVASLLQQGQRLNHEPIALSLVATDPRIVADDLGQTKQLASTVLKRTVNLYYGDKTYAPSKDVVGSWLEFHTVRPSEVLGDEDNFDTPAMLVTPVDQERNGEKPGEPYYVLLPAENFAGGDGAAGATGDEPLAVVGFNRTELKTWLRDTVSAELDVPGQNARFAFSDGKLSVAKPSVPGTGVDVDRAIRELTLGAAAGTTSNLSIKLVLDKAQPAITEDKIDELGIETLIGRGITDASNSPANRFHNIDTGLARFDGVVIAPGETLSTLETLGPIDGYNGFLPELVITGNKITPQYGGGLCQVSSTAFRAAMDSGLPIVERLNHAFVVDHYVWPDGVPGREATIFEPSPDLKFTNDTDAYILIHTYRQADDKVVFEFYGSDPKRTTTYDGPYWVYGGPVSGGKTTFTYTVKDDETGEELQNVEFVSIFQPLSKFKLTR